MDSAPESPDALFVLGCRMHDGRPGRAAAARVRTAVRAFEEHAPRYVITSGGRRWGGITEADILCDALVELGVPRSRIVRELYSMSTIENAVYGAELMRTAGLVRAGVVTSDWHMARALVCFERTGARPIGIPAPSPPLRAVARLSQRTKERVRGFIDRRVIKHWVQA